MKKLYLLVFIVFLAGCSKEKIKDKQEDLIIEAMTTGQWKVTSFTNAGVDITSDFASYKFQFKENLTVDAISNGTLERTGTWDANSTAQTITSTFTGAVNPLALFNGTWTITSTTWTSVNANMTVAGEYRMVRLDKL